MGGDGSGRKPDVVKAMIEARTPIGITNSGLGIEIPNYSGIQEAALKGHPALGTGGVYVETDPIFLALSGTITGGGGEPVYLATSGSYVKTIAASGSNITVFGSAPDYIISGTGGAAESDPVFLALSGGFLTSYTETDPKFLSLSGSIATYLPMALSGAWNTHIADSSDPHGVNITQTGLTVTTLSGGTCLTTTDLDTSGSAIFRNIVIDTTSGGYTASAYTQGSILFVYT